MIKLIVAYDENRTIGNNGKLPWKIKSELQHFKNTTMGDTLIMGSKTFDSLPGKLPGRKHVVLSSRNIVFADKLIRNEETLITYFKNFKNSKKVLWISGGKTIYEKYYQYADEIIVSEINGTFDGDVKLDIDLSNWKKQKILEEKEFTVYKYTK